MSFCPWTLYPIVSRERDERGGEEGLHVPLWTEDGVQAQQIGGGDAGYEAGDEEVGGSPCFEFAVDQKVCVHGAGFPQAKCRSSIEFTNGYLSHTQYLRY